MSTTTNMTDVVCGNCSKEVSPEVQFCSGCGQPLWQNCQECRVSVLLTQQFCNGCGIDLGFHFNKRVGDANNLLDRCEKISHEGKFEQAVRLASMFVKPQDYRFQKIAERASVVISHCEKQQQHWTEELKEIDRRAKRYQEADRDKELVTLLSPLPPGILTEELASMLAVAKQKLTTIADCKSELKKSLAEKRYGDSVRHLVQIVELNPTNGKYKKQLDEIVAKVRKKADALGTTGQFAKAVQMLQSLPPNLRDDEFLSKFNTFEEAVYLRLLLAKATYYTPLIPGILDRLEKITPGDEKVAAFKVRAAVTRKRSKSLFTDLFPEWMKAETGVLGIPVVPIKVPATFPGAQPECITSRGTQFMVALGLAIQAVQSPMPKGDFLPRETSKGFWSLFTKRASNANEFGWGIDVGNSSVKAIRMRLVGDPPRAHIESAFQVPIEGKQGQGKSHKHNSDAVVAALKKIASSTTIDDEPVIINFAGNELITRFVLLPPTADRKKHADFVLQDGRANIPLPMDMVVTALHVSDQGENDRVSPSGIFVAAKKTAIDARRSLVEAAGIKVTGIMPEPFALWNALQAINLVELEKNGGQAITYEPLGNLRESRADLLIDVGHQRTNILIAHPKGIWFRTLDWGLADMSNAICRVLRLTFGEAENMRREPLRASHLQLPLDAMLSACQIPRRELERSAYVARDAIGELKLRRAMLVGGGAFQPFLSSWLNGCEF